MVFYVYSKRLRGERDGDSAARECSREYVPLKVTVFPLNVCKASALLGVTSVIVSPAASVAVTLPAKAAEE
jgi:hypothetical protein